VPALRVACMSLATWGFFVLATLEPQLLGDAGANAADKTDPADVQRVVLVLDVSPSMNVVDAGADQKLRRRDRVLEVVEGIMARITIGAVLLTLIPVALQYFGSAWDIERELPGMDVGRGSTPVRAVLKPVAGGLDPSYGNSPSHHESTKATHA